MACWFFKSKSFSSFEKTKSVAKTPKLLDFCSENNTIEFWGIVLAWKQHFEVSRCFLLKNVILSKAQSPSLKDIHARKYSISSVSIPYPLPGSVTRWLLFNKMSFPRIVTEESGISDHIRAWYTGLQREPVSYSKPWDPPLIWLTLNEAIPHSKKCSSSVVYKYIFPWRDFVVALRSWKTSEHHIPSLALSKKPPEWNQSASFWQAKQV